MGYKIVYSNSLAHHGIIGQKWGIRRYQNRDGSLTPAGKARYSGEFNSKAYRKLKKEVRQKKKEVSGSGNQFAWSSSSGKNSEKALKNSSAYYNSPEYKAYQKEVEKAYDKLAEKFERGDIDDYEKAEAELWKNLKNCAPTVNGKDSSYYAGDRIIGGPDKPGRTNGYNDSYLKGYGTEITQARLMDIGYNKEAAEYVAKYLTKYGRVLE